MSAAWSWFIDRCAPGVISGVLTAAILSVTINRAARRQAAQLREHLDALTNRDGT